MANPTSHPPEATELRRLFWCIVISIGIHVVILVVTSLPYIMRGFRPAGTPATATAVAPGNPAPAEAAPATTTAPEATTPATAAPQPAPVKAAAKAAAKKAPAADPDAEYFQDETLSPADLRKGPELETGLDAK